MNGLPFSQKIEAVGSVIEIFYFEENSAEQVRRCLDLVRKFDDEFSRFKKANQLSVLNSKIDQWQEVSEEMFFLLSEAWKFHQLTDGIFNIGLAEDLENLGYDAEYSFVPRGEKRRDVKKNLQMEFADVKKVLINRKVEFGGLGKGYVLDFLKSELEKTGLVNYLINAGGDIYAKGSGMEGQGWKVVLENPGNNKFGIGEVFCSDLFVAASSGSKRKWKEFHHLLDEEGKPAMEMLGVFVQGESGILVDAMATSLFVMGLEKAREVLPRLGVEAMLIDKEKKIYRTEGFRVNLYSGFDFVVVLKRDFGKSSGGKPGMLLDLGKFQRIVGRPGEFGKLGRGLRGGIRRWGGGRGGGVFVD
ncbi:MAG: FAD:protein FMN transferase [Candidatus Altimarinota bacterium]